MPLRPLKAAIDFVALTARLEAAPLSKPGGGPSFFSGLLELRKIATWWNIAMNTSQSVAFFRGSFSVGLAGFILLAAMPAFGQAQADPRSQAKGSR
jgi:hypothetical protein